MHRIVPIAERVGETPSTVTWRFDDPVPARPGQFVMVWVPGDDELPMSLSYTDGARKGVTVKAMGETSRRIQGIPAGSRIGLRGPYGRGFDMEASRVLVVGGGSGTAVLAPAAEAVLAAGGSVVCALGATTARELLFAERLRAAGARVELATDDGTLGHRGYVTELAARLLAEPAGGAFDALWTCGPEVMMRKALAMAADRGIPSFGSVERWMKCGIGMCDACAMGPVHVCVDGPVLPGPTLLANQEFGRCKRDMAGRKVPI
ncbi:MAG: dihydroorotate dehydrogenase electron transfer subunit [Thermoplasmata archaeon]